MPTVTCEWDWPQINSSGLIDSTLWPRRLAGWAQTAVTECWKRLLLSQGPSHCMWQSHSRLLVLRMLEKDRKQGRCSVNKLSVNQMLPNQPERWTNRGEQDIEAYECFSEGFTTRLISMSLNTQWPDETSWGMSKVHSKLCMCENVTNEMKNKRLDRNTREACRFFSPSLKGGHTEQQLWCNISQNHNVLTAGLHRSISAKKKKSLKQSEQKPNYRSELLLPQFYRLILSCIIIWLLQSLWMTAVTSHEIKGTDVNTGQETRCVRWTAVRLVLGILTTVGASSGTAPLGVSTWCHFCWGPCAGGQ